LLKVFNVSLIFLINKYRNVAVQGKSMENAKFLPTAAGQFCLLSHWLTAGIWVIPSSFPVLFKNCQRLSNSLWAFPSGFPTPFEHFPAAVQQPLRAFPSGCRPKQGNFQLFFLKGRISVYICKMSKEHLKILKTTSGSSSSTDLSNNIIFSQSQSHATVPLSSFRALGHSGKLGYKRWATTANLDMRCWPLPRIWLYSGATVGNEAIQLKSLTIFALMALLQDLVIRYGQ
jgi:hypothetical protein